ncbi:hypothetical protein [Streptomyces acidicola]|uniref:hypothetical protein n=1 Tax=Streptomyces acidicola TaxID=2596892 RepID=UPI0034278751
MHERWGDGRSVHGCFAHCAVGVLSWTYRCRSLRQADGEIAQPYALQARVEDAGEFVDVAAPGVGQHRAGGTAQRADHASAIGVILALISAVTVGGYLYLRRRLKWEM